MTETRLEMRIRFKRTENAKALASALSPETQRPISTRYKVDVSISNNILHIIIKASDLVALRAAMNAYCRYVTAWIEILESIPLDLEKMN